MKTFGLIGFPLSHSFSKRYFTEKFEKEGITDAHYELFSIENLENFKAFVQSNPNLVGLNVTIPHKEKIIPFLDELSDAVQSIKAVNVIKFKNGKAIGYNSDVFGFKDALLDFLPTHFEGLKALVLGTGGAAKGVMYVLNELQIPFQTVSRIAKDNMISYEQIDKSLLDTHRLIINTTPMGMSPKIDTCPDIPYHWLDENHLLYDLVYNPENTLFMQKGAAKGAKVQNGLAMLYGQAEKAWDIWNE